MSNSKETLDPFVGLTEEEKKEKIEELGEQFKKSLRGPIMESSFVPQNQCQCCYCRSKRGFGVC